MCVCIFFPVGSVRIYDFASKTPLVQMKFKQGGTSLTWVPLTVSLLF